MNRRTFIKYTIAIIPGIAFLKSKPQKSLKQGFKYIGEGMYTYIHPSWVDNTGKWHYMVSMHAKPILPHEIKNKKVICEKRIQAAKEYVEVRQHNNGENLAIVFREKDLYDDVDTNNHIVGTEKIYNSTRFFLIDRKTLEKEIWL